MKMHSVLPCFSLLLIGGSGANYEKNDLASFGGMPEKILGKQEEHANIFVGIPFAKKPVRFSAPEEIKSDDWSEFGMTGKVYDATNPRDMCVNNHGTGSEDCLYLDIYEPTHPDKGSDLLGVHFWIHGGSWMEGTKNDFSLKFWATKNWGGYGYTVGVATNYRLSLLGFPDFDGVEYGQKNLGTLDNIQALRFVNKHISDFGGDPNKVTIFGESAGSMQVIGLWLSPDTKGLFKNGISQSPYVWSYDNGQATPEVTREGKKKYIETCMHCACNKTANPDTCTYRTPSTQDMIDCNCFAPWYGPVNDRGVTFPDDYYQSHVCKGDFEDKVPLLIGFNALEINLWNLQGAFPKKKQQMHDWIAHFAPKLNNSCVFDKLGDEYEASGLMQDPAQKAQMMTANGMVDMPQHPPKELYATSGIFFNMISSNLMRSSKVHMYMFNESSQAAGGLLCALPFGAHTCEIPFVLHSNMMYNSSGDGLNQVPLMPGFPIGPPMDEQVRTNMRETWKHFATTDEPGWMTNEVGIFTNGEIHHVDAPFSPQATDLLHKVMCEPDMIPECSKLKCGEVKAMYKDQQCCGMPEHPFFEKMQARRLSGAPRSADSRSEILAAAATAAGL